MAIPNYVKFQRGTVASYNRLSVKDNNTLYFVYNSVDDTTGKLYLGTRLIGSVGESGGATTLNELTDVITTSAGAGSFLVMNSEGNWVAVSSADVASTILSAGGNFVSIDEDEFQFSTVDGSLELKGYSAATEGFIPVKGSDGLIWQAAPEDTSDRVADLESAMATLQSGLEAIDGQISTAIANANHLKYEVVTNLNDATETNVVYLYQVDPTSLDNKYNEYMIVNGTLELIGTMSDVDLSDYVTTADLDTALAGKAAASDLTALGTTVSSLSSDLGDLQSTVADLESALDDYVLTSTFNAVVGDMSDLAPYSTDETISGNLVQIYERLTWQEIGE